MRHKSIVAWALLTLGLSLGACSKDEPSQGNTTIPQKIGVQGNSDQPTETISIELEMEEEEANAARALNYTLTNSYSTDNMLLDSNQSDELPAMLILKNGWSTTLQKITWKRNSKNGKSIWTASKDVQISSYASKTDWWAMVVVGDVDENTKKLNIKKHISTVVDLNQGNRASLDIPYASTWRSLKWNQSTKNLSAIGESKLKLFPLGIVMTYRVTNNMTEASRVEGVRVMTNHLEGTGSYDINPYSLTLPSSKEIPAHESAPASDGLRRKIA